MIKSKVLIIEKDKDCVQTLSLSIEENGYTAVVATTGHEALDILSNNLISMIFLGSTFGAISQLEFLNMLTTKLSGIPVIVLAEVGSVKEAVTIMQNGAADYLIKPVAESDIVRNLQNKISENISKNIVLESDHSRKLFTMAKRVAASNVSVLVTGESGSGKEVICRYIHNSSERASGPFIAINCAAIPENMLESLLFGYEKGAFTGAHQSHAGKFEQAQGGTLLLDEISEIDPALQAKLLRVLQEKEVERICGSKPIPLDVRVLATTNRNLKEEVAKGNFREDLYYRLNVFPLHLSPLRSREEDIIPLANALIYKHSLRSGGLPKLTSEAELCLRGYKWPGNIRELENVIQRALVLSAGERIDVDSILLEIPDESYLDLGAGVYLEDNNLENGNSDDKSVAGKIDTLTDAVKNKEQKTILNVLDQVKGSRKKAAEALGISTRTLRYKLAKLRDEGHEIPDSYSAKCA